MTAQTCQKEGGLSAYSDHSRQNLLVAYILPYPRGGGRTQVNTQATIIKHSTLQISIQLSHIHFSIPLHLNKHSIPAFPRPPASSLGWGEKKKMALTIISSERARQDTLRVNPHPREKSSETDADNSNDDVCRSTGIGPIEIRYDARRRRCWVRA